MNNNRCEELKEALILLDKSYKIIEGVMDEKTDCLDNMPESLQMDERYEKLEEAIDNLEEALSYIDDAKELVKNIED